MPLAPVLTLDGINTASACPLPIPNKHLPICPPGPAPAAKPDTPPASPPSKHDEIPTHSILYPPDRYTALSSTSTKIYTIDAAGVAAALDYISAQHLPESSDVFPWLHGLHPNNHIQLAFFIARRRSLRRTPSCLRGITIVKANGDLSSARLKGAIAPGEFLQCGPKPAFKDVDPREGFSVRNFQIQAPKLSMVSDIIVYGEDEFEVQKLGWDIATAQHAWRETHQRIGHKLPQYNTFICTTAFHEFETKHSHLVATNSAGQMTGNVMDFFYQERLEMSMMTKASEIATNVWLGPTPDPAIDPSLIDGDTWDILIECSDAGRLKPQALRSLVKSPVEEGQRSHLEFPSSGSVMPPSWSLGEADAIVETCKWIHALANGYRPNYLSDGEDADVDAEGDSPMPTVPPPQNRPRKILIHCTDGYTESSMLALAYYIYANGVTVGEAWLQLHTAKQRNFFAYQSDVALLNAICPRFLAQSPALPNKAPSDITAVIASEPRWLANMDGSLPSRILDYMYLGNLGHANNPELLKALNIGQILSVGETASWRDEDLAEWGPDNVCVIKNVQDNGVDPLTEEFDRCLAFIGMFQAPTAVSCC